jgi:two-component system OmpR family sensor kinase
MKQLAISLLLVVVLAIIGAGWAVDSLFQRMNTKDTDAARVAEQIGYQLVAIFDQPGFDSKNLPQITDTPGYSIHIMQPDEPGFPDALRQLLDSGQAVSLESTTDVSIYLDLPKTGQVLVISVPAESQDSNTLRLILTLAFYSAVGLLVLIWLLPLIRRLHTLTAATERFGQGELSARINTSQASRLFAIESAFNSMARRIQTLLEDNRLLTTAVSHDLRTPLARLRFGVDALEETKDSADQRIYINRISKDVTSMESLVEVLLDYARLEQRMDKLSKNALSLSDLVADAIAMNSDAGGATISFNEADADYIILGERRCVSMLLDNVLQNAIRHSHKQVDVSLVDNSQSIFLHVDDDGEGFDDSELERLLKPFERGKADRDRQANRAQNGFGLGLAIVDRVAYWHGASVTLSNDARSGGARVSVCFPRHEHKVNPNVPAPVPV